MKSPCYDCDLWKFTQKNTWPGCEKCKARKAYLNDIDALTIPPQSNDIKSTYKIVSSKISSLAHV